MTHHLTHHLVVAAVLLTGCPATDQLAPESKNSRGAPTAEDWCGNTELEGRIRGALARAEATDPRGADIAEILMDLAAVCRHAGKLGAAKTILERAVVLYDGSVGAKHPAYARALVFMAEIERDAGDPERALHVYIRAREVIERARGKDDPSLGTVLNGLGTLHFRADRLAESEGMYRRALEIAEKHSGAEEDMEVAMASRNLALTLRRLGRTAEALGLVKRAMRVYEGELRDEDPIRVALARELKLLQQELLQGE